MHNNLAGYKFNKLEVIEKHPHSKIDKKGNKRTQWLCKCVCGQTKLLVTSRILSSPARSCGCERISNISGKASKSWNGYKDISGTFFNHIKSGARTRKIECSISIEYLQILLEVQQFKCAISGIDIYLAKNHKEIIEYKNTASLDRIDSSKGYIEGNVQWLHKDVNYMKQWFSQEKFVEMCHIISEYQKKYETTRTSC